MVTLMRTRHEWADASATRGGYECYDQFGWPIVFSDVASSQCIVFRADGLFPCFLCLMVLGDWGGSGWSEHGRDGFRFSFFSLFARVVVCYLELFSFVACFFFGGILG